MDSSKSSDEKIKVDEALADNLSLVRLTDCINFEKIDLDKRLSMNPNRKVIEFESKFPMRKMDSFCDVKIGGTPSRSERSYFENGTHLWVSISEMDGNTITDTKEKLTDEGVANSNVKLIKAGTTLLSFKLSIGKTAIAGADLYTNEAIAGLEILENEKENISDQYLYHLFSAKLINLEKDGRNAMGSSLNSKFLKQLKIPVPPLSIQQKIITETEAIEAKEAEAKKVIEEKRQAITKLFDSIDADQVTLKSITSKIGSGATPPSNLGADAVNNTSVGVGALNSINSKIEKINWKPDLILASYHGIPKKYFDKGDPYHCYCHKTSRLIHEKFNNIEIKTTFQSRFGPEEWLQPYTDKTLESLPKEGIKNVLTICPGFSSDCVETLEEILIQGKESFMEAGGENFDMIPCLNDNEDHIKLLNSLIKRNI